MSRSAIRAKKQQKAKLSAAQRKFNTTIRKIEKEKQKLADWQEMTDEFQQQQAGTYLPLMEQYDRARAEMAQRFDRFFVRKSFSNLQREKMAHLICEVASELVPKGFDELRAVHDRYSELDFDTLEEEENSQANDVLRDLFAREFGVDLGDDFDMNRPEEMADRVVEQLEGIQQKETKEESGKKQTAAEKRKAEKVQEEEENISQSIKSVYRQLTTALHPDREADEGERVRKTELMQKVTRAYRDKDLLKLLELQLEVEQIDQTKIDGIADSRLKHFNKVLQRQLEEVSAEVEMVSMMFKQMARIDPFDNISPQEIMEAFEHDTHLLRQDTAELEDDLKELRTVKGIQQWLKNYHLPRMSPFGAIDELFGGMPPGFFR